MIKNKYKDRYKDINTPFLTNTGMSSSPKDFKGPSHFMALEHMNQRQMLNGTTRSSRRITMVSIIEDTCKVFSICL